MFYRTGGGTPPLRYPRRVVRIRRGMVQVRKGLPHTSSVTAFAVTPSPRGGSEPSAASGRRSEVSEWQRSADEEGACRRRRCRAPQQEGLGAAAPVRGKGKLKETGAFAGTMSAPTYTTGNVAISPESNGNALPFAATIPQSKIKRFLTAPFTQGSLGALPRRCGEREN